MFSSNKKSGCGKLGPMRVDGDGDYISRAASKVL